MTKIKVIIAEDSDIIRENYIEILSKEEEIEVIGTSATGTGAVQLFLDGLVADIVLMDVEMETQTAGIVSAKEIFALNEDVKIIFLSVHEDERTIVSSMATGAVDYMVKNDDAEKIISHIKRAYQDKVELEMKIQKYMRNEFLRLSQTNHDMIKFTKKVSGLTPSEREIIKHLLGGLKIKDIAEIRCVESVTIKTQIGQLLKKFEVKRTKEIVKQINELQLNELFL